MRRIVTGWSRGSGRKPHPREADAMHPIRRVIGMVRLLEEMEAFCRAEGFELAEIKVQEARRILAAEAHYHYREVPARARHARRRRPAIRVVDISRD